MTLAEILPVIRFSAVSNCEDPGGVAWPANPQLRDMGTLRLTLKTPKLQAATVQIHVKPAGPGCNAMGLALGRSVACPYGFARYLGCC